MSLKGLRGRVNLTTNETKDVTVTEDSGKVAIDVNIVSGGADGSADSTSANQVLQIAEAEESNDTLNEIETNTQETTDALVAQTLVVSKAAEQVITNVKLEDLVDALATQTEIQPTSNVASVVKVPWDNFQVTAKNGAGSPTSIEYKLGLTLVATVTITYDADGDLQSLVVS